MGYWRGNTRRAALPADRGSVPGASRWGPEPSGLCRRPCRHDHGGFGSAHVAPVPAREQAHEASSRVSYTRGPSRNRTRGANAAARPLSPAHLREILPVCVAGRTLPARKRVSLMQQIRRLAGVGTLIAPPRRPRMRSRFKAMCTLRAPHWAPLVSILELLRQSADVLDGWPLPDSDRDRPSNRERIKGPPARHGCSAA
jgi:hypothetical protein